MDLIDLNTPKPANPGGPDFSPTLMRGLNECFRRNAAHFQGQNTKSPAAVAMGVSNIMLERHSSSNLSASSSFTPKKKPSSKRCPTTPLTPSLNESLPSKRRVLGESNQRLSSSLRADKMHHRGSSGVNKPKIALKPHPSRSCSSAKQNPILDTDINLLILDKQRSEIQALRDFLMLEEQLGLEN